MRIGQTLGSAVVLEVGAVEPRKSFRSAEPDQAARIGNNTEDRVAYESIVDRIGSYRKFSFSASCSQQQQDECPRTCRKGAHMQRIIVLTQRRGEGYALHRYVMRRSDRRLHTVRFDAVALTVPCHLRGRQRDVPRRLPWRWRLDKVGTGGEIARADVDEPGSRACRELCRDAGAVGFLLDRDGGLGPLSLSGEAGVGR